VGPDNTARQRENVAPRIAPHNRVISQITCGPESGAAELAVQALRQRYCEDRWKERTMKMRKEDIAARMAAHTVQISGRTEPARIPYCAKMNSFFLRYREFFRPEISKIVVDRDVKLLDEFADNLDAIYRKLNAERNDGEMHVCENRASLDIPAIAAMVDQFDRRYEEELSQQYKSALGRLSAHGQSAVLTFIDTKITPHMNVSIVNRLTLYTEFPELLEAQIYIRCSGDTEAVKRANEELLQQLKRQEQVRSSELPPAGIDAFGGKKE
jgi:hypothetical protein